uniref:Secreted protein n=1 Tax=Heterorhabditis bacteriophora TaxID=37862 RepID=A0A1I7WK16_HETBA
MRLFTTVPRLLLIQRTTLGTSKKWYTSEKYWFVLNYIYVCIRSGACITCFRWRCVSTMWRWWCAVSNFYSKQTTEQYYFGIYFLNYSDRNNQNSSN